MGKAMQSLMHGYSKDQCYRCREKLDETWVWVPILHTTAMVHFACVKKGQKYQRKENEVLLNEFREVIKRMDLNYLDNRDGKYVCAPRWLTKGEANQ